MAVAHPSRLLEAALPGQAGHPGGEGIEQQRRFALHAFQQPLDHRAVGRRVEVPVAGAERHPQLGGGARAAAPPGEPRAAPHRHGIPDGLGHQAGGVLAPERPEVEQAPGAVGAHQREPGEGFVGEPDPVRGGAGTGAAVVARVVGQDEAQLGHLGLQFGGAHPMLDRRQLPQHLVGPAPVVPVEVGPHPGAQVGRLAHVEDLAGPVAEQVHPGAAGEGVGQADLAVVGGAPGGGQLQQVLQVGDAEGAGPLEEAPEHVGGGPGILQGPMVGGDRGPEVGGQRTEAQVAHLRTDEAPGQGGGVHRPVGQPPVAEPLGGGVEEGEVEAHVVADHHRLAEELEEGGQSGLDGGGLDHHGLGDAGEHGDEGGDLAVRVHQGVELTVGLAAVKAEGADLGDAAPAG